MNNQYQIATPYQSGQWDAQSLDLDAYLRRIGFSDPLRPSLDTLRELQRAHLNAIVFENIDVILGIPILIDLTSIQDKLVYRERGGYCHEHNILFAAVLERLGFSVTGHSARIMMGNEESILSAAGHTMLTVLLDNQEWLVDVGVGNIGPREPIALIEGIITQHDAWWYRIDKTQEGRWILRYQRNQGWFNIYQFSLEPYYPADYEQHNHYVSTHPKSVFTRWIIAQFNGAHLRYALLDRVLKTFQPNNAAHEQQIAPEDIPSILRNIFKLQLSSEQFAKLVTHAQTNQITTNGSEQLGGG